MRTIKFRAWDKKRKKWMDNRQLILNSDGKLCCCYSDKTFGEWKIDYEVVFSTGLHDKNGKEIFEGDIVEWNTDADESYNGKVKETVIFEGGAFYPVCTMDEYEFEVIGNKFENPELLEQ